MLTSDLVRVRKKGKQLSVVKLEGKSKQRALALAEEYLTVAREQDGQSRAALKEAWGQVEYGPREQKLADGLAKLIEDKIDFVAPEAYEPRELRSLVFLEAARQHREDPGKFSRTAVFEAVAEQLKSRRGGEEKEQDTAQQSLLSGVAVEDSDTTDAAVYSEEALESALYADLKSEQRVSNVPRFTAEQLVERYDMSQYQAVLLKAVKISAWIRCSSVSAYRSIFRELRFRRLLHTIEAEDDGYRIIIDGPFSLFDSVTKYGLQLALAYPALCRAAELKFSAELKWGKARQSMVLEHERKQGAVQEELEARLPDEVERLLKSFDKQASGWTARANRDIISLPGVGVVVPDLVFRRGDDKIYLEVLGFWSRDAVWKRVELVEKGLPDKIVFAVSERLRVSEAVLDKDLPGALYVYKGTMSARAIMERLNGLS